MLQTQQYLLNGKTLDDLKLEFGIEAKQHDSLPLVILNYSQIDSPKSHPIVRECRALVLNSQDWSLVAKGFNRFFNFGEVPEPFDFSNFIVQTKEDGSLVLLYFFNGEWHANTRGSFALDKIEFQSFTWREAFCKALKIENLSVLKGRLREDIIYVAEFCSPWNKVVRRYDSPQMFLLTAFQGETEIHPQETDTLVDNLSQRPQVHNFCSVEEIQAFLQEQAKNDATFEGVVIRDCNGYRYKIKSPTYLGLHKLRGNGDNIWNPKHLLPFVLTGEEDELLTYFEEVRPAYFELKSQVLEHYVELLETWSEYWQISDQKEFALLVKDKSFSSILFNVRKKYGVNQTVKKLKEEFMTSDALILKRIRHPL